jgi:septal ring factor EnvC (AmiA/AmiB activator)
MNKRLLFALFLILSAQADYVAASPKTIEERLREIEQSVEAASIELVELTEQVNKLKVKYQETNNQLNKLKNREKNIDSELKRVVDLKTLTEDELREKRIEHLKLLQISEKRLFAQYVTAKNNLNQQILTWNGSLPLHKIKYYSSTTYAKDNLILSQISESANQLEDKSNEYKKLVNDQNRIHKQLELEKKKIEAVLSSQKQLVKEIENRQSQTELRLAELQAQSLRLETVMASLTNGSDKNYYGQKNIGNAVIANVKNTTGNGFKSLEKKLNWPLKGKVVKNFGKEKIKDFATQVTNNGITIETTINNEVRSVLSGKVAHVGQMTGLGNFVLVDHGQRDFSLYAKLSESTVEIGQEIEEGDKVGNVGMSPSGTSGLLYFELRRAGKAINPLSLLRPSP